MFAKAWLWGSEVAVEVVRISDGFLWYMVDLLEGSLDDLAVVVEALVAFRRGLFSGLLTSESA